MTYEFKSNLFIDEFKKLPKEKRVLHHHPKMLGIEINVETQTVIFSFQTEINKETLVKIIYHFKYSTYELR